MRFNPPPGWPQPPAGWVPPPGWNPDPAWPPLPEGWNLWVDDNAAEHDQRVPAPATPEREISAPASPPAPQPQGLTPTRPLVPPSPDTSALLRRIADLEAALSAQHGDGARDVIELNDQR